MSKATQTRHAALGQLGDAFLRLARAILTTPAVPDPVAVRAAALLGRVLLERVVADRLARELPGAEQGSMRAQLLCLRSVDHEVGGEVADVHGDLSHACHHHPYELGPSVDEVEALLDRIEAIAGAVAGS